MKKNINNNQYKKTLIACYLGFITQAIMSNFITLLYVKFHNDYNISLVKIAYISTVFFFTQLLVDLFCAKFVDKIGYRKCIVISQFLSGAGLISLAILVKVLKNPYIGIILSVIMYAIGSGLIEVLVSPIVEACPFENKIGVMSLLHSFYCWGVVVVILFSTIFFAIFGIDNWHMLACVFAIIPMINIYNFSTCKIEKLIENENGLSVKKLLKNKMFWIFIILMVCAGSSEIAMAQWASAYVELALGISKKISDLVGPLMFAIFMGISRVLFGKFGEKINLKKYMIISGILCVICYLCVSLTNNSILGLAGCMLCGFSVGIMWPGTISITSKSIPFGGTAMFALLAMAGDLGGSIGPYIIGLVTQNLNNNLKTGILAGSIFPIILVISIVSIIVIENVKNEK